MKKVALVLGITLFFGSCKEPFIESEVSKQNGSLRGSYSSLRETATDQNDKPMILGKKLQNPYTIENMKKALENVNANRIEKLSVKIEPNYIYVRFLPANDDEYSLINRDKNLDLYSYPLDYEIKEQGNRYKDPLLKSNSFTWQYAAVKIDYKFPKIKYEILASLFLPAEDENLKKMTDGSLEELENVALLLADNLPDKKIKNGKTTSFVPTGRVLMFDDVLNTNVPIKGCRVRTRVWFSTETTLTDSNGYFNTGVNYNNTPNFSILWSRNEFEIFDGDFVQATFNGPQQSFPWNLTISSGKSRSFALAHRAAWLWYYTPAPMVIAGLIKPPYVRIAVRDTDNQNSIAGLFNPYNPNVPKINVWTRCDDANNDPLNYRDRSCLETFGSIAHELGHAAHWGFNSSGYHGNIRLSEAWAEGIKYEFCFEEYGKAGDPNRFSVGVEPNVQRFTGPYNDPDNFSDAFQIRRGISFDPNQYPALVRDLFDNFDQEISLSNIELARDRVSGYTISQFQAALLNTGSWNGVRDYLRDNYDNPTEIFLDELFTEW